MACPASPPNNQIDDPTNKKRTIPPPLPLSRPRTSRLDLELDKKEEGKAEEEKLAIAPLKMAFSVDFHTPAYDSSHHTHGMNAGIGPDAHHLKDSEHRECVLVPLSSYVNLHGELTPRVLEAHHAEKDKKPHTPHLMEEYTRAVMVDLFPGLPK